MRRTVCSARSKRARLRRPQDRLHPHRRAAARHERAHRGHHRRDPVRVRRLARAPAHEIMDAIRDKTADIPGILVEVTAARRAADRQADPGAARALDPAALPAAANKVAAISRARDDIRDLDDGQPLPGIDWKIEVDKAEAAKYGAGVNTVGARSSSSPTGSRRPNTGRSTATSRSTSWCASCPTGAASTRSTSCACRPRWARADRQFRAARARARVGYINRVNGNRDDGSANIAEGVQTAKVQQEIAPSSPRPISARA